MLSPRDQLDFDDTYGLGLTAVGNMASASRLYAVMASFSCIFSSWFRVHYPSQLN